MHAHKLIHCDSNTAVSKLWVEKNLSQKKIQFNMNKLICVEKMSSHKNERNMKIKTIGKTCRSYIWLKIADQVSRRFNNMLRAIYCMKNNSTANWYSRNVTYSITIKDPNINDFVSRCWLVGENKPHYLSSSDVLLKVAFGINIRLAISFVTYMIWDAFFLLILRNIR